MIASVPFRPGIQIPKAAVVWFGLAAIITGANLMNHASFAFSLLSGLFVLITYAAVTAAGGPLTLFGIAMSYIAFQHVMFASLAKLVMAQPIEQRLDMPVATMEIYCLGMSSAVVGCFLGQRVAKRYKRVLFPPIENPSLLRAAAWGALICEVLRILITHSRASDLSSGQTESGGLVTVVMSMLFLSTMPTACATAACVMRTNKQKCFDWLVMLTMLPPVLSGVVSAGRGDTVFVLLTFFITALLFGFRFRAKHFGYGAVLGYIMLFILFPYARYARNYVRSRDIGANIREAAAILEDVIINPAKYQEQSYTDQAAFIGARGDTLLHHHWEFYSPNNETLSRFSNIKLTDMLAYNAEKRAPLGWLTTIDGLELATPSIFQTEKPLFGDANMLMHLVPGYFAPSNHTTQPNIGLFADNYVSFRWIGVATFPAVVVFLYFVSYGYLTKLRLTNNIYAIALLPTLAGTLSEGALGSQMTVFSLDAIYAVIGFGAVRLLAGLFDVRTFANKKPAPARALLDAGVPAAEA